MATRNQTASVTQPGSFNLIKNPSFETETLNANTISNGWIINTANAAQKISNAEAYFGSQSLLLQPNGTLKNYIYMDVPYIPGKWMVLSCYMKCTRYVAGILRIQAKSNNFANTFGSLSITSSTFGWTRFQIAFRETTRSNVLAGCARIILDYNGSSPIPDFDVYVDGIQVEEGQTATPYIDGTLGTGFSWKGTAHNSISLRKSRNIV